MIIYPRIPSAMGCEVVGYLYDAEDPNELGQDMVEVTTPNGVIVSCGWYPEGDEEGAYRVRVTQGFRTLNPPFFTRNIEAAASEIEKLAELLCNGKPLIRSAADTVTFHVSDFHIQDSEDYEVADVSEPRFVGCLVG